MALSYAEAIVKCPTRKRRSQKKNILTLINKALSLSEDLLENERTLESMSNCAYCHSTAADCFRLLNNDSSTAINYKQKAVELSKEVYTLAPTLQHARNLSVEYCDLGQFTKSIECFLQSYHISKTRLSFKIERDLRGHALTCSFLSALYFEQNQIVESKKYLEEGLLCIRQIHDMEYHTKMVLADLIHLKAKIKMYEGDNNQALYCYMDELTLREDITAKADTLSPYADLSDVYCEIAGIHTKLGNDFEAVAWGIKAAKTVIKKNYSSSVNRITKTFVRTMKYSSWFTLSFGIKEGEAMGEIVNT